MLAVVERLNPGAFLLENVPGLVYWKNGRMVKPPGFDPNKKYPLKFLLHGQMDADELEGVMARFIAGKIDVLVCTTIIESGLDIPNANTIIIDRADQFGLADLYQLRGRVGRAEHKAYAYLLLPREMMTVGAARKRISAIKQYSSLGAGFRIAMTCS